MESSSLACFSKGRWYSPLARLAVGGITVECVSGVWQSTRKPVENPSKILDISFPLHQAETPHSGWIDMYATAFARHPEFDVVIVGLVNPREGQVAERLARRRSEVVRDRFIGRGIAAQRLTIGPPEQRDGPQEVGFVVLRPRRR